MGLGDSLGASFGDPGALGRVLGALRELLGDVLGLESHYLNKMKFSPRWEHNFGNLSEQGTGSACK